MSTSILGTWTCWWGWFWSTLFTKLLDGKISSEWFLAGRIRFGFTRLPYSKSAIYMISMDFDVETWYFSTRDRSSCQVSSCNCCGDSLKGWIEKTLAVSLGGGISLQWNGFISPQVTLRVWSVLKGIKDVRWFCRQSSFFKYIQVGWWGSAARKGKTSQQCYYGSGIGQDQWDNQVDIGRIDGGGWLKNQSVVTIQGTQDNSCNMGPWVPWVQGTGGLGRFLLSSHIFDAFGAAFGSLKIWMKVKLKMRYC